MVNCKGSGIGETEDTEDKGNITEERQRAEGVPHKFALRIANLWGPRRGQKGQGSNLPVLVKFNTFFILCLLPKRFEAPEFIRGEDNQIWSEMRSTRYNTSLLETPKFIYGVSFCPLPTYGSRFASTYFCLLIILLVQFISKNAGYKSSPLSSLSH